MDKTEYLKAINVQTGANIANLRIERDISQASLGKTIGKSTASVVNIENGRQGLNLSNLMEISIALDVDIRAVLPSKAWYKKNKDKKVTRRVIVEIIDETEPE